MIKTKIENNKVKLTLNLGDYPREAIYGASYVFLDKAYLFLNSRSPKKVEVVLKGKKKLSKKKLTELEGEFSNELLNYTLRINLAKRNKSIREYIISQALLSAIGEEEAIEEDGTSFQDDPLGIAVPWEEKYQEDKKKGK